MTDHSEDRQEKDAMDINRVEQRYSFEEKEVRLNRFLRLVMILFLSAGLLGLFGEGLLSGKKVVYEDYEIDYRRFVRSETSNKLYVHLKNAEDTTVISFDNEYAERVRIDKTVPEPESVETKNGRLTYTFTTGPGGLIIFYLFPLEAGPRGLDLLIQGEKTELNQFVFI